MMSGREGGYKDSTEVGALKLAFLEQRVVKNEKILQGETGFNGLQGRVREIDSKLTDISKKLDEMDKAREEARQDQRRIVMSVKERIIGRAVDALLNSSVAAGAIYALMKSGLL